MKKLLVALVVVAVVLSVAGVASAKKEKIKGSITTEAGTTNFKVIKMNKKGYTTEKGKVVSVSNPNIDKSRGVRVETLKFKQYHDNKIGNADFVTMVHDRGQTIRQVSKNAKVNHLMKGATNKKIKVYSTYNLVDNAWKLHAAEVDEILTPTKKK